MIERSRIERLVAVVVTHNRADKLRITLERLLAEAPERLSHVVVVDNASGAETVELLKAVRDTRLVLIRNDDNLGGAGGFAMGMRAAVETCQADWLVLMDDDGYPARGALDAFHTLDKSGWDALAAAVYFPTGEICEMNRPSRNPFWHGRQFLGAALRGRAGFHLRASEYDQPELFQIDVTSFVGFFVRRSAVERLGYPDPGLFIYGDDGIYTLGLSATGGRIAFASQVRFEHDLSTFAGQRGRFRPLWKAYYYHRNLLILYRKAAGPWFGLVLLAILPRWALKSLDHSGTRWAYLRLLGRAVQDGLAQRKTARLDDIRQLAGSD